MTNNEDRGRMIRIWATASSLLCVGLVAYVVGLESARSESQALRTEIQEARAREVARSTPGTEPKTAAPGGAATAKVPAVPPSLAEQFAGLGGEWISRPETDPQAGFALLVDLSGRQELIAERCRHPGYFDDVRNVPIEPTWDCETVVSGRLVALEGGGLALVDRAGQPSRLQVKASGEEPVAGIDLRIGKKTLSLVPGSKNDLLQRILQTSQVRASKAKSLEHLNRQIAMARTTGTPTGESARLD